jgi:hypothetical protein
VAQAIRGSTDRGERARQCERFRRTKDAPPFRDGQLTRVLISNELTDALEAAGLRE